MAVGTVEPRKNLPLLVSAHRLLPEAPPLVLVGGARWAGEVAASPRVHLTGYVPDEDLRRIVAGARVLAYPSRREGFGLPPLEALACGVPVVVSDLPVLREVLGGHARFVPVGDAEALSAGLAATLSEERTPAGTAAARAHAASFTWERFAGRIVQVYRDGAGPVVAEARFATHRHPAPIRHTGARRTDPHRRTNRGETSRFTRSANGIAVR